MIAGIGAIPIWRDKKLGGTKNPNPTGSDFACLVERPQPTVNTPHGRKRHFQSVPQSRPAEYRHGDRPVPAVEDQSHSIVIEVDGPEENIHHSPAVVLVVDISPFQ